MFALPPVEITRSPIEMNKAAAAALEQRASASSAPPRSERVSRASLDRGSVLDRLELRGRQGGEWEPFIDRCLQRFHESTSVPEKAELLKRIARALEIELGDADQAFDALLEAMHLDPSDHEIVASVAALAGSLERWPELIEAMRGFVHEEPEPWRKLLFCEQGARWCKEELKGSPQHKQWADAFLVEIHRIDPSHWAVRRRLASFYSEQGTWDLRRTELERALLRARSTAEMLQTHFALAELHELRFNDLTRAMDHYEAAYACDPRCLQALQGMERICIRREMFDRLREVLERQIPLVGEPSERHALLLRLADLWEVRFLKPAQAAPMLEEALRIAPGDKAVVNALERCYRAQRAWPAYARTLERLLEMTPLRETRIQILMRIGQVHDSALGDPASALEAYRRAFQLEPSHIEALTEMARLCERTQDWRSAAECRSRLADLTPAPRARAHIQLSAGALLEPEERDPDAAREAYERAVAIDPACAGAWEGLQRLAEREGDYRSAAACLVKRVDATEGPRARARLLIDLGQLCEVHMGSKADALDAYERAHGYEPANLEAADSLLRLNIEARRWPKAATLSGTLLRRALDDGDAARTLALVRASARVAEGMREPASALVHALRARTRFPESSELAIELIDVCHALRDAPAGLAAARDAVATLARNVSRFPSPTIVRIGEVLWAMGETERGIDAFVTALNVDEACVPALTNLAEHFLAEADWERFSAYRLWLARATPDGSARFALLLDTGEMLAEHAADLEQAAWVYEEARAITPRDRRLLERLVSIYTGLRAWERLLSVQRAIAEGEELPELRAGRVRSMAVAAKTKLEDHPRAADLFDEVLELDPERLDALDEVAAIYKNLEDWRALGRAHRRMLLRADRHAREVDAAIAPRLPLAGTSGSSAGRPSRLPPAVTEVSASTPMAAVAGGRDDAELRALRDRIAQMPLGAPAYRSLYGALRKRGMTDAAWCVCSALRHLGVLDGEQKRFMATLRAPETHEVPGSLSESAWYSCMLHAKLDRRLTAVLNLATALAVRTHWHGKAGRMTRALGEPLTDRSPGKSGRMVRAVKDVVGVLGLPVPQLYARAGSAAALTVAPTQSPALFVSFQSLDAAPAGALPFVLGRHLAELHPLLLARAAFPTASELRMLYETATRAAQMELPAEADRSMPALLRKAMSDDERTELDAMTRAIASHGLPPDVETWHHLANVSTMRAGLLLAGNVDAAWEAMRREERLSGAFPAAELRAELLTFSVSDEHFRIRQAIGMAVG
jgi:tetratricopeptide (TPR) repeat protein